MELVEEFNKESKREALEVAIEAQSACGRLFVLHIVLQASAIAAFDSMLPNRLSFDLLESWLAKNPDVSGFKRDGKSIFRELALFQNYHGLPSFKKALVDFMAEIRGNKVTFDPNHIVLTACSTSANETLMFCLAEQGDAFLLPTPYYPGFDRDLKWRTEVEIVPIQCTSSNNFQVTEPALKQAYEEAHKLGLRVKGVLVTNPSNPWW